MSQADIGTLDPTPVTGTSGGTLITLLNAWRTALHTNHSGASRPAYAVANMIWVKTVSGTAHEIYYFDGTDDILLAIINPSTNKFYMPTIGDIYSNPNNAVLAPASTPPDGMSWDATNDYLVLSRSAGAALHVVRHGSDGIIQQFYRNNSTVGGISVTTTATVYSTSSDYRLKEDVEPILTFTAPDVSGPLGKIMRIRPVKYRFKADESRTLCYGFIAHELQEEIPHAVTGFKDQVEEQHVQVGMTVDTETGSEVPIMETREVPVIQGVDHSQIMSLAVSSLQQLTLRVLELEAKLSQLTTLEQSE